MAHPNLWGTTDTRNGLPTTTRESPDFSHGECQFQWSSVPITFPYYPKKPEKVYLKEEKEEKKVETSQEIETSQETETPQEIKTPQEIETPKSVLKEKRKFFKRKKQNKSLYTNKWIL